MKEQELDNKRWLILTSVMLAFLPVVIDMTVLHVAIPSLTQSLGAANNEVLWIIDIYPLLMAGLLVPMGTLADRIGNRRIMLLGLFIFSVASILAAFSPTASWLIASRSLLAVGGAMIIPCVLGTIRRTFVCEKERAMALGIWSSVGAFGAAFGPLFGGLLLDHFWWGSVFLINVPVMLLVWPVCYFLIAKDGARKLGHWPVGQAIIFIIGTISIVYAIKVGVWNDQDPAQTYGIFFVGLLLLIAFTMKQIKSKDPLLDISLFKHPAILAGIIMALIASGAIAGVEMVLAQELQYVLGMTPLMAGIFMVPIMGGAAFGGPVAGFLSNKFGLRNIAFIALIACGICLAYISSVDLQIFSILIPIAFAIIGITLSISLTASSIAIMGSVEPENASAAGALEGTGYELGAGLGITFFGVLMGMLFSGEMIIPNGVEEALGLQAQRSIGDTFIVANQLQGDQMNALIDAGKVAYKLAHSKILLAASFMIMAMAVIVYFLLASYKPKTNS